MSPLLALGALLLDRIVGDPDAVWRRVPHPVVGFGACIALAERGLNRPRWSNSRRKVAGIAAILLLVSGAALVGLGLHLLLSRLGLVGLLLECAIASLFLAQRSLAQHVERVRAALREDGLAGGRRAVSMIVGRDPEHLDEAGVCRAAIESLAENASDGVVAPWLYLLVFGLPGLLAYKMLNTADSMIGRMDARHRAFGYGAARLDDLANWPAARLTAGLFVLATLLRSGARPARRALEAALRDASTHRSPNAGWPEAAVAGGLDLALGGPRRYGEIRVEAAMLHAGGRREAAGADIGVALGLLRTICNLLIVLGAACALAAVAG